MFLVDADQDGIYARAGASIGRLWIGLAMIYGLGALLIYLAVNSAAGAFGVMVLLALAAGTLWAGERMRRHGQGQLQLTETALIYSDGRVVAELEDIVTVSRGAFAAKPSNGFNLTLAHSAPRAWVPGLWWRFGRRVGVGGVINAGAAKFLAEQIALRVAERDTDR